MYEVRSRSKSGKRHMKAQPLQGEAGGTFEGAKEGQSSVLMHELSMQYPKKTMMMFLYHLWIVKICLLYQWWSQGPQLWCQIVVHLALQSCNSHCTGTVLGLSVFHITSYRNVLGWDFDVERIDVIQC